MRRSLVILLFSSLMVLGVFLFGGTMAYSPLCSVDTRLSLMVTGSVGSSLPSFSIRFLLACRSRLAVWRSLFIEMGEGLPAPGLVGVYFVPDSLWLVVSSSGSVCSWFSLGDVLLLGGLSLPGEWVRFTISMGLTFFWFGSFPCPSSFGLFGVGLFGMSVSLPFMFRFCLGSCRSRSRRSSSFCRLSITMMSYCILGCLGISTVLIGPRFLGRR